MRAFLAVFILNILFVGGARAATFTVTKTADTADGVCDEDCSLREALIAANELPGLDDVTVPPGRYLLTIENPARICDDAEPPACIDGFKEDGAQSGDLDLTDDVRIRGAGAGATIVESDVFDRVFDAVYGSSEISDLSITGGRRGPYNESEILGLFHPVAGQGGGVAVERDAVLTMRGTLVFDNRASGFLSCTLGICSGQSASGGGIWVLGNLELERSTVWRNVASYNFPSASSPPDGSGLAVVGTGAEARLTNVTISGNPTADETTGFQITTRNGGALSMKHSTVSAPTGACVGRWVSGAIAAENSVLDGRACSADTPSALHSLGYNVSDGSCSSQAAGDVIGDPMLDFLGSGGGPTPTHALLPGSPAIDLGFRLCPRTDQRGFQRIDPLCDAGAWELDALPCFDVDGDGFLHPIFAFLHPIFWDDLCGFVDCDDRDATINPYAAEVAGDGIDQNCNGSLQCGIVLSGDESDAAAALVFALVATSYGFLIRRIARKRFV